MMNTRIQTLLAKFKETESTHRGAHVLIGIDEIEKFAESIVKECADAIIKDSRLSDVRSAANGCVRTIKEHFGVEE